MASPAVTPLAPSATEPAPRSAAPSSAEAEERMADIARGLRSQPRETVATLERDCARKDPLSCGFLGSLLMQGTQVPRDADRAVELFTFACNHGDALSCESMGGYVLSIAGPVPEMLSWYEKGCALGNASCCMWVGAGLVDMAKSPADYARAVKALTVACDGDADVACNLLGRLYSEGKGVEKSTAEGERLRRKACTLGYEKACEAR